MARLEEAMARVPDSYFYSRVLEHLDRCDKVFKVSQIFKSEAQPQPSRVERITGDTERAIFQSEPLKADKDYWEVYLRRQTDWLKPYTSPTTGATKFGAMPTTGLALNSSCPFLAPQIPLSVLA